MASVEEGLNRYPTPTVDLENNLLFALLILENTIVIELVQSKRNGRPGGWKLIQILVDRLVPLANAYSILAMAYRRPLPD